MSPAPQLTPAIERVLSRFRSMGREEKMQALVGYAKRLEPVPERFASLDRAQFTVPECQTRVDLFSELRDGVMHYWAGREHTAVADRRRVSLDHF